MSEAYTDTTPQNAPEHYSLGALILVGASEKEATLKAGKEATGGEIESSTSELGNQS